MRRCANWCLLKQIVYGNILSPASPPLAERGAILRPPFARGALLCAALAILAILPYLPVLVQPFVSDDYIQLDLGRKYGPVDTWADLAADALYRCRATSIVITHWTEHFFGVHPLPYYVTSIAMHVLNSLLLFGAAWKLGLGGVRSYLAAVFFALQAGHQEAVMWYAALPELLLFFFCGCFLLSWNSYARKGSRNQFVLALLWFVLALLSKEAAVILVPVAAAILYQRQRGLWPALPLAILAAIYTAAIFAAKADHLHLNDGTFSLRAPFVQVWALSIWRMFWVWGLLSVAALAAWRRQAWRTLLAPAFWISVAILPFCFLLYMPVVPSRHTYLASAGVGFFVAAGALAARARFRQVRWVLPAILTIFALQNTGYVWTKKRLQFLQRTEATESLLQLARHTDGLIYVTCFPYGHDVAEKALEIGLGQSSARLVWNTPPPPGAVSFCAKDP
ncbi:MAG: hypothetical protein JNM66_04055 [Bryobacterales bacterium]|nr:hypothetical protein [Bryobacterales bacterium]